MLISPGKLANYRFSVMASAWKIAAFVLPNSAQAPNATAPIHKHQCPKIVKLVTWLFISLSVSRFSTVQQLSLYALLITFSEVE
jgi:hypothetical protein